MSALAPGIGREDEATPFVRSLARVLSLNTLSDEGTDALSLFEGPVALVSATDPQRATIARTATGIHVRHGAADEATLTLTIDPTTRQPATPEAPENASPAAQLLLRLINPALPAWQELTPAFWSLVRDVRGLPPLLLVDTDSQETVRLGGPGTPYEIHGKPDALAALLAGTEYFPDAVFAGRLFIRGPFRGFSSVTGASMKVVFDV